MDGAERAEVLGSGVERERGAALGEGDGLDAERDGEAGCREVAGLQRLHELEPGEAGQRDQLRHATQGYGMGLRDATNYASGRMDRDLDWAACRNVRDLGGLPTAGGGRLRRGALVRGDALER